MYLRMYFAWVALQSVPPVYDCEYFVKCPLDVEDLKAKLEYTLKSPQDIF